VPKHLTSSILGSPHVQAHPHRTDGSELAGKAVADGLARAKALGGLAREHRKLAERPEAELNELTQIYVDRGVAPDLARQVAQQMMARDAFTAHARDELGLAPHVIAHPVQAALTSAATFAVGAAFPLAIAMLAPARGLTWTVSLACLIGLAALGAIGARVGGSDVDPAR
jgi:VIT1/CCC1 family predicted Fe2+/Mn2+ transporter